MSPTMKLAMDLIARPSLTPDDADCQQLIVERMLAAGFAVEWHYSGPVSNVLISHGAGAPWLCFLGHTDVVPTGPLDQWTSPPFEPVIRDGLLYGRGAADMKSAVAAMVIALEGFVELHPDHPGRVGLMLTSDEEGLAEDGVKQVAKLLKERADVPDYCLVGEPSSQEQFGDTIRIGRRGSISAKLTVHGIQGHSAFPHKVDNPVHKVAGFLSALVATHWDDGNSEFPPTHCQVTNFQAGTGAENVTPGTAELMFNFRNSPVSSAEDLHARVEGLLHQNKVDKYTLDWRVSGHPFCSSAGQLRTAAVTAVQNETGLSPDLNTGGGTSDGRFIAPLGTEVLEFGVRNASIHKIDEHAAIADIDALERIYGRILQTLY